MDGDQRLCLLGLAMLSSETIPDNTFVSVHPILGVSLLVGARLLAPLASTDCTDPLDGLVALAPRSLGPRIHAVFFGGITILMSVAPEAASASYIGRVS